MTIGKRLKQARQSLGINQNEMSKRLKISQSAYSKLENDGSSPSADTFERLTSMGINVNWILTGSGNMTISDNSASSDSDKLDIATKMLEAIGIEFSYSKRLATPEELERSPNIIIGKGDGELDMRKEIEELKDQVEQLMKNQKRNTNQLKPKKS